MVKFAGVTLRDQSGGFTVWSRIVGASAYPAYSSPGLSLTKCFILAAGSAAAFKAAEHGLESRLCGHLLV
jgi:hypothetical protein